MRITMHVKGIKVNHKAQGIPSTPVNAIQPRRRRPRSVPSPPPPHQPRRRETAGRDGRTRFRLQRVEPLRVGKPRGAGLLPAMKTAENDGAPVAGMQGIAARASSYTRFIGVARLHRASALERAE